MAGVVFFAVCAVASIFDMFVDHVMGPAACRGRWCVAVCFCSRWIFRFPLLLGSPVNLTQTQLGPGTPSETLHLLLNPSSCRLLHQAEADVDVREGAAVC